MGAVAWAIRQRSVSHPRSSALLRPSTQQSPAAPVIVGVCRLIANHHDLAIFESAPEVRALSSASITRLQRSYDPVRLPPWPSPSATLRPLPSPLTGLPRFTNHLSDVPCPLPRRIERVRVSIASPLMLPSPFDRRVGIRIVTFEACSGFTHVTARQIAQPPKAAFVTRLQPCRLPGRTARQLPDQSTTLWAESSSASNPRLRGARSNPDFLLGGRTSVSAESRLWSGRAVRWSSCASLLRAFADTERD